MKNEDRWEEAKYEEQILVLQQDKDLINSSQLIADWADEVEYEVDVDCEDAVDGALFELSFILERLLSGERHPADVNVEENKAPDGAHRPGMTLYHGSVLSGEEIPSLSARATNAGDENTESAEHVDALAQLRGIWMAEDRAECESYTQARRGRSGRAVVYEYTIDSRSTVREVDSRSCYRASDADTAVRNALSDSPHALRLERGVGVEWLVLSPDCLQLVSVRIEDCGCRQTRTGPIECGC